MGHFVSLTTVLFRGLVNLFKSSCFATWKLVSFNASNLNNSHFNYFRKAEFEISVLL